MGLVGSMIIWGGGGQGEGLSPPTPERGDKGPRVGVGAREGVWGWSTPKMGVGTPALGQRASGGDKDPPL